MLNFANIENYKENNRIEAKKALGGLPKSIWETYSAFANTHGGIILLGVEEYRDKTFHTVDLPYPHEMVEEFLSLIEKMTNVNILRDGDVSVEKVDGKHIIAIRVPRAHRHDKPVYIGSDPLTGTYRRNGEGDYRCTNDEVRTMIRDSKSESLDMAVITRFTEDSLNIASIDKYISQMETSMPLSYCDKLELLLSVGAVVKDENGICHPTSAGLLMFGKKEALISEFKNFSAVFRNHKTGEVYSADNLFDFFMHVTPKLGEVLQVLKGKDSHSELFYCAREALINCLTNADFRESGAVNVTCSKKSITFSNPGDFRIDPEKARHGGVSDSRNCAIAEIFSNINMGRGKGAGIPYIYSVWKNNDLLPPTITETFSPSMITVTLPLAKGYVIQKRSSDKKTSRSKTEIQKSAVMEYLTVNITADTLEISKLLGVSRTRARRVLSELQNEKLIAKERSGRSCIYRLMA